MGIVRRELCNCKVAVYLENRTFAKHEILNAIFETMGDTSGGKGDSYLLADSASDEPPRQRNVLVLTDFSEKVHAALTYAAAYARATGGKITLLHVAKAEEGDRSIDLSELLAEYNESVQCDWLLLQGDFLTEVSRVVEDVAPAMVIIGSQHLNTPELYKKSLARTLFKHLKGTYLLVQEEVEEAPFQRVLLPVDFTDKPECTHEWLELFAPFFACEVYLVMPQVNENELQEAIELNRDKVVNILETRGISYREFTVAGNDEYTQEILAYGQEIAADLIVINSVRSPEDVYILESHERSLILHARQIPVLVVNS